MTHMQVHNRSFILHVHMSYPCRIRFRARAENDGPKPGSWKSVTETRNSHKGQLGSRINPQVMAYNQKLVPNKPKYISNIAMSLNLHVEIYMYIWTYVYMSILLYICTCLSIISIFILYIYVNLRLYIYVYLYIYVCLFICSSTAILI